MTAAELLSQLRQAKVKVWAEGDRLRLSAPGGALTPDLRAGLAARKEEVLSFLREAHGALKPSAPPLLPVARDGELPLSFAQQRLWFLDQLDPGSAAYNIPTAVRLPGQVNVCALEAAVSNMVLRHESLRTCFANSSGRPAQVVGPPGRVPLPLVDLGGLPQGARAGALRRLLRREALAPFDLARGPLLRVALVREGEGAHVLSVVIHHIVSDAWSTGLLVNELTELYRAYLRGVPSPLAPLAVQYADYAAWQRRCLEGEARTSDLEYWRGRLAGSPASLDLPTDRPHGAGGAGRSAAVSLALGAAAEEGVRRLGLALGATPFMVLMAAFDALLYRYTGQTDLVLGTPVAGRPRVELEGLVGFFVNILPVRAVFAGELSFGELVGRVREACLGAFTHQEVPFERLVEELGAERNLGRNPLCQVFFTLGNRPGGGTGARGRGAEGLLGESEGRTQILGEAGGAPAKFDLTLYLSETANGIRGALQYDAGLFDATTARRLARHYERLVETAVASPGRRLAELPLLGDAELHQVLREWNDTRRAYPCERGVHDLFAEQARRTPDAVAVADGDAWLTYGELERRANRLARYLRRRGVAAETPVGVLMGRSTELVVALLGVLKAGGAYLPLEPTHPAGRLVYMIEDSGARLVLTLGEFAASLPPGAPAEVVSLDAESASLARESGAPAPAAAGPDHLAYVIYTSGSTGEPKGAMATHRNVVRLVRGTGYAAFGPEHVFMLFAPTSFDASTFELWGALLNGARIEVFPPHSPTLAELAGALGRRGVTTLWLTAGLFHQMAEQHAAELGQVRQLLGGGDALSAAHVARTLARMPAGHALVNGYGPTEATTFACTHKLAGGGEAGAVVPIGRPISNARAYVLDGEMRPAPVGAAGELYLGGDGLARGYLARPGLTAEKFVPDPFAAGGGGRLYRTGDVVRQLARGEIEFLGRLDSQVKVRGFRVEPGEVEAVLRGAPGVRDLAVVAREDGAGGKRLIAYVVAGGGGEEAAATPARLREWLRTRLPEFMVPSLFVTLGALPLTPNGKVDRKALPAPGPERAVAAGYVAPRDTLEHRLVLIWEEVLGVKPVGVTDNFFEVGGHSLLAVRLLSQLQRWLGAEFPLALLFQAPTVEQLARAVRRRAAPEPPSPLVAIQPGGTRPPFFCVHPGSGDVFYYVKWARHMGPDQPFYGLQDPKLFAEGDPYTPLAQMAAAYVAAVRAARPAGPYCLGGWSFGGHVAFEMARQLRAQGEEVALLALIDTGAPAYLKRKFADADSARLLAMLTLEAVPVGGKSFEEIEGELRALGGRDAQVRHVVAYLREHNKASRLPDFAENFMTRALQLFGTRAQVIRDYEPGPYAGEVTLLRATERLYETDDERRDEAWGWDRLSPLPVRVRLVPGNHATLGKEPHVRVLAEQLRACIDEACPSAPDPSPPRAAQPAAESPQRCAS